MKKKRWSKQKGLSPVIATVLLIAMVMVIGLIIFLWFKGMIGETGTKFGKNIKLACEDVKFEASYEGSTLFLSNTGSVPIFGIKIKIFEGGSHKTKDLKEDISQNWPVTGLKQGGTFSDQINDADIDNSDKIKLIPVLLGILKEEEKTFTCDDQHGYEIFTA